MSWRNLLYLVGRNLRRMKLRVAMTSIGVLIGTSAIILLVSLGAGLQRLAHQDLASMGELTEIQVISGSQAGFVMASSGQEVARLNDQALREFRDLPGVTAVVPEIGLRLSLIHI